MSGRRSKATARRAIRDRWVPTVLRVTLGLALSVGLSGLALGTYLFSGHSLVGQSGPSLAVPLGSSAVAGDGTGSASPDSTPSATVAGDPSQPPAPSTAVAAPSASSTAKQTRASAAKVNAQSLPSATTAVPQPSAASSSSAVASSAPATNATYEQQVLALTNAERTAVGCPALTWNGTLASVARAHSQDMATNNYFDHNSQNGTTPEQRITAAGYTYTQLAENIAAGQATPADVLASWMGSAGHKANILNCSLTQLGVGYATGGSYGSYWTQDFGTP